MFLHKNKDGVGSRQCGMEKNESIPHPPTLYISHIMSTKVVSIKIFRSSNTDRSRSGGTETAAAATAAAAAAAEAAAAAAAAQRQQQRRQRQQQRQQL